MSSKQENVIVIDDGHDHAAFSLAQHDEAVKTLMSVMNIQDEALARAQLEVFQYDAERTIAHLLQQQEQADRKPAPRRQPAKRALFQTDETQKNSLSANHKKNGNANDDIAKKISSKWHECMKTLSQINEEFFVDSDFPPTAQSLDGRQRRDESKKAPILCHCGIPAAPRTVQSDGPNYGRFYLACGQQQVRRGRRAPVVVVRKDDTPDNNDDKDAGRLTNPYAKKQPQSPPKSPPQRRNCKFFRWDPDGSIGASGYATRFSLLSWQHFGLESNCCLYKKEIGPSQVRQGAVGNCWFLSALAVVAEKPYLVRQLLPHDTLNEKGCYQINLCLDGQWTPVIVDSSLPVVIEDISKKKTAPGVSRQVGRGGIPVRECSDLVAYPAFCAAPDQQLWPALVEKAYAKAHGSYAQLSGGFIAEGLTDLTGAPTETIVFAAGMFDGEELWVRLLSFAEAGFLMGVATSRGGDGLVGGHAYSLLDVVEVHDSVVGEQSKVTDYFASSPAKKKSKVNDTNGNQSGKRSAVGERQTIRLVRIRNPWGKREWKGDWSADSERWTKTLRKRLGSETFAKGDGTFFMSFDDMLSRFHHMDVAKTREGWVFSSSDGAFRRRQDPMATSIFVYELVPSHRTIAFISLIQPKKRSNTQSKYWYCDPSFLILKRRSSEDDWTCEAKVFIGVKRTSDCEVFLDPSYMYCCFPFSCVSHMSGEEDFSFRLTTYSAAPVATNQLPNDRESQAQALSLIHKELLRCEQKLLYPLAQYGFVTCVHGKGCLFFIGVNGAADHYLSLRLTIDVEDGILVAFGKEEDTHDIAPRSQKVLLVVSGNGKFSATTHLNFRYLSDVVPVKNSERTDSDTTLVASGLNGRIAISMAGDLIASAIDQSQARNRGGDTVDTYLWIPQLGSST